MSTVPILIAEDTDEDIVVDRPSVLVGRSRRRSDVRINDRTVSSVHCEISVGENCLKVRNQGRNGIRLNGRKVDDGVLLDGDILEIAKFKFRLKLHAEHNELKPVGKPKKHSKINEWYVQLPGIELGPMPWVELAGMVERGEITVSDKVRWAGEESWKSADQVEGLMSPVVREPGVASKSDTIHLRMDSPDKNESPVTSERAEEPASSESTSHSVAAPVKSAGEGESTGGDASQDVSREEDPQTLDDTATSLAGETATSSTGWNLNEFRFNEDSSDSANDSNRNDSADQFGTIDFENDSSLDVVSEDQDQTLYDDLAADIQNDSMFGDPPTEPASPPAAKPLTLSGLMKDGEADQDSGNWSGPQVQPAPVPRPLPPPPKFAPPARSRESAFEKLAASVIEPVLTAVPLLQTWPGVAAALAGIGLIIWMIMPSYEGAYVTGRVTLDGQPLNGVSVTFTDLKSGYGASAVVGEDGSFEVETLDGGMMPGTYSIAVMPLNAESPEIVKELQRQYQSGPGANGDSEDSIDEAMTASRKIPAAEETAVETYSLPPGTVPFRYRSIQTSGIEKEIRSDGSNELLIELQTG